MSEVYDSLTPKEKAFAEEYVNNGGNASRAYFATYNSTLENARKKYVLVMRRPRVKAYIEELQKAAYEAACINAERIGLKLAEIAFAEKGDTDYNANAQLKALAQLSKNLGLEKVNVEAKVDTIININVEE